MLYIGHFSFDELKEKARHGYFTGVIDADDHDAAVAKFTRHILELKKSEACFASIVNVYMEDIIEVEKIPVDPIVTLFQSAEGAFPKSISVSLPAVTKDGIRAFGLPVNVRKNENEKSDRYIVSEPFIRFEEK